jgi:hypothetical protein
MQCDIAIVKGGLVVECCFAGLKGLFRGIIQLAVEAQLLNRSLLLLEASCIHRHFMFASSIPNTAPHFSLVEE